MVKLKDYRILLTAIDTWMLEQVLKDYFLELSVPELNRSFVLCYL